MINYFIILLLLLQATSSFASSKDQIKKIYLERFVMFIEWPYEIKTFNMCIYDDRKFAKSIKKSYKKNLFNGYPLKVKSIKKSDEEIDISECHIFYMRSTDDIEIKNFKNIGTLLISDNYDDIYEGCMISFYQDGKKSRFVINQKNLNDANLKVSYKLLDFAKVIDPIGESYVK